MNPLSRLYTGGCEMTCCGGLVLILQGTAGMKLVFIALCAGAMVFMLRFLMVLLEESRFNRRHQ